MEVFHRFFLFLRPLLLTENARRDILKIISETRGNAFRHCLRQCHCSPFCHLRDIFPRPGEVGPLGGASARPQSRAFAESGTANAVCAFTTPPVKMRLERSAELVGAKPLHLLTQTALPLKSPTGAFIAALRSANAVAPNAKFKIFFPLNMCRAQRSTF